MLENGPTLGAWPFVSYNNNAIGVQSYSSPPIAHAPISGSLKSAGLDMKLLPGEAYDGVQQSYCLVIQIRPRFTADRGASVRNNKKVKVVTKLEEK